MNVSSAWAKKLGKAAIAGITMRSSRVVQTFRSVLRSLGGYIVDAFQIFGKNAALVAGWLFFIGALLWALMIVSFFVR